MNHVCADGKVHCARRELRGILDVLRQARFSFRGVPYGTFRPSPADRARFPEGRRLELDVAAMHESGSTAVRTYATPLAVE